MQKRIYKRFTLDLQKRRSRGPRTNPSDLDETGSVAEGIPAVTIGRILRSRNLTAVENRQNLKFEKKKSQTPEDFFTIPKKKSRNFSPTAFKNGFEGNNKQQTPTGRQLNKRISKISNVSSSTVEIKNTQIFSFFCFFLISLINLFQFFF